MVVTGADYSAGRFQQMKEVAVSHPYWRYRHSPASTDPRPEHVAWDGLILKHDDPFWAAHTPPNGFGCKCYVETLADRDLKKGDLKVTPEGQIPFNSNDPKTGLPQGVGKGWDYQPGASVAADLARLKKMREDKLKRLGLAGGAVVEYATQKRDRLFEEARREVMAHGQKTGNERLVLLDAKTGETLDAVNGAVDKLVFTDAIRALIQDANHSISLIHNHPGSSSFSKEDIRAASLPGADSIEAIGHDGSRYKTKPKLTDYTELGRKITDAQDAVMYFLSEAVSEKRIALEASGQIFHHIINLVLAKSGVIDYNHQLSAHQEKIMADSETGLNKILDKAIEKLKH